ncbi:MAG: hypothetical protein JNJ40_06525 [Bacteroidia bacterium]|nr:hypothetical protein [Bacteroidia bacterium]
MAVNNFKRSERERMLASVNAQIRNGEHQIKMLMQVLGVNEDVSMTRIYSAFIKIDSIEVSK